MRRGRRLRQLTVPSGTNPTVISWRLRNLRSAGFKVVSAPGLLLLAVLGGLGRDHPPTGLHLADLAGVGRPGRALLAVRVQGDLGRTGYFSLVLVSVNPVYPSANLPRVALLPASLAFFGAMAGRRSRVVVRPVVAVVGEAGSAGSMVPQMSKARPACHVVPTVGSTTAGVLL